MNKYLTISLVLVLVALGVLASALLGLLPPDELPFALGIILLFGALLFLYARLRLRDE